MIIAFSGLKGSGKDTAAKVLIEEYGFTKVAFADALREALLVLDPLIEELRTEHSPQGQFFTSYVTMPLSDVIKDIGWDHAKNTIPEVRRLLQVFGTEVGRMLFGENVWVDLLTKRFPDISDPDVRYVITDCRFDNEVEFVRRNLGSLVWVDRPGLQSDGHASESTHIKDLASVILHNDGTIEELEEDIRLMLFMWHIDKV
jgi:hypothetical protein